MCARNRRPPSRHTLSVLRFSFEQTIECTLLGWGKTVFGPIQLVLQFEFLLDCPPQPRASSAPACVQGKRCIARTLTSFTIMRIVKAAYGVYLVQVDDGVKLDIPLVAVLALAGVAAAFEVDSVLICGFYSTESQCDSVTAGCLPDFAHALYVSAWTESIDCVRVPAVEFIACRTLLSFCFAS